MSCKPSKFERSHSLDLTANQSETKLGFAESSFLNISGVVKLLSTSALPALACAMLIATGCNRSVPTYLNDTGDLSHYLDQATKIDYPDVEVATLDEVTQSLAPMTVIDPDFQNYEELSLEDAVAYALQNGKIFRGYGTPSLQGTRVSPGQDNLANGATAAGTIYAVGIRETEPGFIGTPGQIANPGSITTNTGLDGNQGVESALADFDAQFTSGLTWSKSDEPRNTIPNNQLEPLVFQQDQVQWNAELSKRAANGTQIFFRNINQYTDNSNPLAPNGLQVLDSFYRASFEAEIRQPLLRGRGAFINRMPVVISRIGTDQVIANLEAQLQNFVTNIEIRYWDLYCAYRNLDAATTGRDAALQTWRIVKDQFDEGSDVNIQNVAQASEQYHFFDAQVIDAYNSLLNAEGALRFLLGWAATDGRVLRPIDEPVMAPVEFAWCESLCEALSYRPELRQERWEIKKKELSLAYSKNGLLPELNATMLYRYLGLGNKYATSGDSREFPSADSAALNELYGGDYQELSMGVDFRMPIGYRRELANVRNAQLKLAQEIARLEDMELDVSKELSESFRALAANQLIMQSSFNRWKDTTIEEEHFEELKDAGVETLDVALDAQRRRSQAEIAFYTALCEYNKVIALIHRRKGTTLSYCNVCFSEGPWPGKAYQDAEENARRRSASRQLNYGWTRPQVISRGQNWPTANNVGSTPGVYSQPVVSNGYPVEQAIPMNDSMLGTPSDGQIYNGPYYENEVIETPFMEAPIYPSDPTPAMNGASNRVRRDTGVQQTSYEEPTGHQQNETRHQAQHASHVEPANQASENADSSKKVLKARTQPVGIRKTKSSRFNGQQANQPQKDSSAKPLKRLKAQTGSANSNSNGSSTTNQVRPQENASNSQAVVRTGTVNWERFGLSKPKSHGGQSTVAKIKTN